MEQKQSKVLKTILALTLVVFIPFGLMVWMRIHQSTGFASLELILYPLIFGGGSLVVLYILKKYFLKEHLSEFNSAESKWHVDLGLGIALAIFYFILFFVFRVTLTGVLDFKPNMELLGLMLSMREKPFLLFLWFGPVLWIGIALYEELMKIFILTSLWKFSNRLVWISAVIVVTSAIFGILHWSQGSYGVVTIAIKTLASCIFFYKQRRLMPLIYAHVLYDGLQVGALLITY